MVSSGTFQPQSYLPLIDQGSGRNARKYTAELKQVAVRAVCKDDTGSARQGHRTGAGKLETRSAQGEMRLAGSGPTILRSALLGKGLLSALRCGGEGPNPLHQVQGTRTRLAISCSKMVVPGFGEKSPEAKAADSLHNFFTFLAVKIVLSQLQAYNREAYADLREFADRVSLKDGDKFLAELMRESPQHKGLAMRILEVRSAYAREDFEWDNLKRVSEKVMEEGNTRLMRDFLLETSKWSDVPDVHE